MGTSAWSAQQLAEFVAAVTAAEGESSAATTAVERAAEAFDADAAAIVRGGELVVEVGFAEGRTPVDELARIDAGIAGSRLEVPGVGLCAAAAAALEHPPGATLVVARADPLTREESSLLRGMARVASTTMRMLRLLDDERAAREELERLTRVQTALRRVATLVAEAAPQRAVFAAVTEEVGRLLSADHAFMAHYGADDTMTVVAAWSATGKAVPVGFRRSIVAGQGVSGLVRETRRPARIDRYTGDASGVGLGLRSAVAAPITVEGRLWGLIAIASSGDEPPPPGTEERLADFTELVATAIANAEARAELTASRARIMTTADETRRRIERDLHDGAQQRLVSLALQLRAAQVAVPADLDQVAAELDRVAVGLNDALDELHEFARGIHPAILAEGGLRPALKALARRSAVPVDLDVRTERRLPQPVEVAVYYIVSEALTNVAKHSQAASVSVEVEASADVLRVRVRDDGVGGADFSHGSGLVGLRDRIDALGGRITLQSRPGRGTSLSVELPLAG
jgi:signal transduction histidine kinase